MLQLSEVGEIAGRVVRTSQESFAVEFIHTDKQRDALIRKVYSGRYYQTRRKVRTGRLFGAVMARALR